MPSSYLLYILAFFIVIAAQSSVQNAYHKYKQIRNHRNLSGAQVARMILDANGLQNVAVEVSKGGVLSDHYDPTKFIVRLSPDNYYNQSIASISIAAHEVGHAIQHKEHYGFIALRNKLLPAANIASNLGWITLVLGLLFFQSTPIIFYFGILLLVVIALFQLITLPVEFNASTRAIRQLEVHDCIVSQERGECQKMLRAAAFTYVAALVSSIIQILRLLLIARRRDD